MPKDPANRIQVQNRQRQFSIDRKSVTSFCAALLRSLDQPPCILSIIFMGKDEMRQLNFRFRGKDYATDVLSFFYPGQKLDGIPFLGEIVIAPAVASGNALRYRASAERELRKLLVHGVLHLLGYDHETDRGQMDRFQSKLLRRRFFREGMPLVCWRVSR